MMPKIHEGMVCQLILVIVTREQLFLLKSLFHCLNDLSVDTFLTCNNTFRLKSPSFPKIKRLAIHIRNLPTRQLHEQ